MSRSLEGFSPEGQESEKNGLRTFIESLPDKEPPEIEQKIREGKALSFEDLKAHDLPGLKQILEAKEGKLFEVAKTARLIRSSVDERLPSALAAVKSSEGDEKIRPRFLRELAEGNLAILTMVARLARSRIEVGIKSLEAKKPYSEEEASLWGKFKSWPDDIRTKMEEEGYRGAREEMSELSVIPHQLGLYFGIDREKIHSEWEKVLQGD